jgi:hypothetical protein
MDKVIEEAIYELCLDCAANPHICLKNCGNKDRIKMVDKLQSAQKVIDAVGEYIKEYPDGVCNRDNCGCIGNILYHAYAEYKKGE